MCSSDEAGIYACSVFPLATFVFADLVVTRTFLPSVVFFAYKNGSWFKCEMHFHQWLEAADNLVFSVN